MGTGDGLAGHGKGAAMGDRQCVLIIDDAGRFVGSNPFEPEYVVYRAPNAAAGAALLSAREEIAIAIINLEHTPEESLPLLKQIRAKAANAVLGVVIDSQAIASLVSLCEAGADEIIMREVPASVHEQIGRASCRERV